MSIKDEIHDLSIQDDRLKSLKKIELSILREFLRIVEKYQLRYFMLGGTLLGAVRHQGFIPWDDDIDLGMPRSDYELFLKYAENELKPPYEMHTALNEKGPYSYYYIRVVDTRVKLRRRLSEATVDIPAWIDIFPLDGVPSNKRQFRKWSTKCKVLHNLFEFSQFQYFFKAGVTIPGRFQKSKTLFKQIFYRLGFEKALDTKKIWYMLDKALKMYSYEESDRIINFCGHWGMKEMFEKKYYGKGKLYDFEGFQIYGPENYDAILTQMYGDYMTPPPAKARNPHSIEIVEMPDL